MFEEDLKRNFRYDRHTGHIYRLIKNGKHLDTPVRAERRTVEGYMEVIRLGKFYKAHRLAWWFTNGVWPTGFVDHINRIKDDNRIINLRDVTPQQSACNTPLRRDNRSGHKGVYRVGDTYQCQVTFKGVTKTVGYRRDIKEACDLVQRERESLHKEYHNHY